MEDRTSRGLTQAEVRELLKQRGYNELPEKQVNPFLKLLGYFNGPIPWMIEAAAILSALVRHWVDFAIILVLLVANAVVGFWEEYQAGNAIAALKARLALKARVKREGHWQDIPARELVPGDLILLRLGDIVPADALLVSGESLEVDQSALTGESLPVKRGQSEQVYSGSIIRQGEAEAEVNATGKDTFMGKSARLVAEAHTVSHFQKAVLKIGNYLIVLAIVLVVLIFAVALFRGDELTTTLQFALVLTVAAIPVAMPTVLSVTLAVGARLLARKQAIVSRLSSIEELAGMDVLCSDKTGTLTQNRLTLGDPYCAPGIDPEEVLLAASLASRDGSSDTIDRAVLDSLPDRLMRDAFQISRFIPFDPVSKRTEATVTDNDGRSFRVSKGAPQVILALADDPGAEQAINEFARRGFRSLGVAKTDARGSWLFLGILPLFDPPREDSRQTIATAREMGVQVKMVTGDQLAIGRETASQLGLGSSLMDVSIFNETKYHEGADLTATIERADGFAQVFPEHKFRIVEVLQRHAHIVGMTGDGVNDAPALKKADCGIAVSGATDAARMAADMVLLTPGLSVIIDALKESRKIFQRMKSYAIYRIAETIRVLLFMTLSILVFNFYPVTAVMIVLLALLNDGAILSIAYDRVRYSQQPEIWNMHEVLTVATALGIAGVLSSFGLFYIGEEVYRLDRDMIQSLIYLKLSVAGHMMIFLTRTQGPFWKSRPSNILLLAVVGTQILATLIAVYGWFMPPIGWGWAAVVWGYALLWSLINEGVKLMAYRMLAFRRRSLQTSAG